jgi:hypothetical protein
VAGPMTRATEDHVLNMMGGDSGWMEARERLDGTRYLAEMRWQKDPDTGGQVLLEIGPYQEIPAQAPIYVRTPSGNCYCKEPEDVEVVALGDNPRAYVYHPHCRGAL